MASAIAAPRSTPPPVNPSPFDSTSRRRSGAPAPSAIRSPSSRLLCETAYAITPKAVEQVRKLVESDEVLLTFQVLGTPSNAAVQKYLNSKKVPQLFAATGASKFTDPKNFPWTMGFNPNYFVEGRIYGQYIIKEYPNAKIGILYQNDDLGKDYLNGIKAGLGDKAAKMIVAEASYEVSDPTIDSQILKLKDAE